jgi:phage shock protein PspC (stress-responsive transcriptional regulator)
MEQQPANIFRRDDTFFGVCHAIGEDFGINPNWVRVGFTLPLFFLPIQTIAAYLALGVVVLISRWRHPDPVLTAQSPTTVASDPLAIDTAERETVSVEPTTLPLAA